MMSIYLRGLQSRFFLLDFGAPPSQFLFFVFVPACAGIVAASAVVASATVAFLITCSTEVTAIVAWERPAGKHRLLDQRH